MEGCYSPAKLKRKNLEQVNDDVGDFSLSSPATKIRCLDVELLEEEDMKMNPVVQASEAIDDDLIVNEERAIVLYDPMNNNIPLLQLHSPLSLSVNSDFLSGLKNPVLWLNQSHTFKSLNALKEKQDEHNKSNGNLAVVPWVPMQSQHQPMAEESSEMMEIEEDDDNAQRVDRVKEFGSVKQWQQHCMIPHNLSTPIDL